MIKAGIVGATGYTGAELLRLLLKHPRAKVVQVTSRSSAGRRVDELFPNLRGCLDLVFAEPTMDALAACDVVFFATPNGTAMQSVPRILEAGARVIDLSADFRIRDPAVWQHWYRIRHVCPELLADAVYGLPELWRESIRTSRLVANPGCYPTAVLLGLLPLLQERLVDTRCLIADVKSGLSGAGRKAQVNTLLCEAGENFKAYAVTGHRHSAEITQALAHAADMKVGLTFVPHLVPMIRGIQATLYARAQAQIPHLQQVFQARYADEPFVHVLPAGSHAETRSVRGTNQCRLAVHQPSDTATVVVQVVIDNLIKGAAGQAVQNMNLMFGLEETLGLTDVALFP